jgi:hypothetical protein
MNKELKRFTMFTIAMPKVNYLSHTIDPERDSISTLKVRQFIACQ